MKKLILLIALLCATAAHAQTTKTEWIAVPVDPAASGASTKALCAAAVKKLYGASMTCVERVKTSPPPAPVTGSATVSWSAPTTKADGSPLSGLAGYRVLYGQSSGTYTQSIAASASPLTVPNLGAGAWFFVVKAIDSAGLESAASVEVSKTIQ